MQRISALTPTSLTPLELVKIVTAALKSRGEDARWNALYCVRARQEPLAARHDLSPGQKTLTAAVALLTQQNQSYGEILRRRFEADEQVTFAAAAMHMGESTLYAYQREAIAALAQIVGQWEAEARAAFQRRLNARLPLTSYPHLVGVKAMLDRLLAVVGKAKSPTLLALEGIGGIGKSSLADALVRRALEGGLFAEAGWVSAQENLLNKGGEIVPVRPPGSTSALLRLLAEQLLPAALVGRTLTDEQVYSLLQQRLQETPHLIVIDNLETVADRAELLAKLRRIGPPSRFLLTTRESLYSEDGVFCLSLPELSAEHALALVRQEAAVSNLPTVEAATPKELGEIYATVGGNPLALRLVVGQLHLHPLHAILDDLRAARGLTAEQLYTFIYWQAWQRLDELARQTLLASALFGAEGDTLDYLAEISLLPLDQLRTTIAQLVKLNLVEVRGELNHRRYAIHGLTRTFLLKQVAKWQ